MSLTRFRSYNPSEKPYSRRRTEEEWEPYHLLLSEMHTQRYTRKDMLARLRDLGFDVSPGQLLSQMKKWDMMVYGERVSQSGLVQQPLDKTLDSTTLEPSIVYDGIVDESLHLEEKPVLEDPLLVSPLSYEEADSHTRRLSAGQNYDDISDGASFSSLDDAQDTLVAESSHGSHDTYIPPPISSPYATIAPLPVIHALGSDAADPSSILRQVSTITEPWCGNFPTACCCQALFRGQGDFRKSPELYRTILEQSPPQSLKYVFALLNLIEIQSPQDDKQELRTHVWDTINYYLQLCTRINLKNKLAPHILQHLLKVWSCFSDGDWSSPVFADLFRSSVAGNHELLINKILKTKPSSPFQQQSSHDRVDWHIDAERDVGCVVGFTVRQPSTFPLLNCDGKVFGSIDSWSSLGTINEPEVSLSGLIPTANQIATYMQSQWYNGISIATAYDLGDCDIPLIFTALGLMIALETTSFASNADFTNPESWTPGLQAFVETTVNTLSLNADYADKFRKAYWLVRCETIGHTGKTVHMGEPCRATNEWQVLDRSIHDYDEERTWFERRLFSGRHDSWPQVNDLMNGAGDNMSITSENSFGSFRKFRALALHMKIGTPASRSLKTKSSSGRSRRSSESHMSWQLEQMLQIRDDEDEVAEAGDTTGDIKDIPSIAQRAQMDEIAFQKMQAIAE